MYIGIDIGGTKCAVVLAEVACGGKIAVKEKIRFSTEDAEATLSKIVSAVEELMPAESIGISCGGPLDEDEGVIMSPPNLPGWDNVHIAEMLEERFGIPVQLMNDANACALAEWRFGAGRGTKNMIFMTFGTGLGAGLILDGKLYSGTNGNAGEIGHIRLAEDGPIGFGKHGSFEGFCSGGGISRIAQRVRDEAKTQGREIFTDGTDTKTVADLAMREDADAVRVFDISAEKLGLGLAVLVDAFNPERIVIGSVYQRAEPLFREKMMKVLEREALPESLAVCNVVAAELGDEIGDYAAIAVAEMAMEKSDGSIDKSGKDMKYTKELAARYPVLSACVPEIESAISAVVAAYSGGSKILLVGNGGSAADCEHISGEFLKGFLMKRDPKGEELNALEATLGEKAALLQRGIPAIPLTSLSASLSAFANDVDPELAYAQLVYALGKKGDVLIAISTSGNAKNVAAAARCARALGITVVSLTGKSGGELATLADISIKAPESETFKIQEFHLPIYHAICADAERIIFEN